MIGLIAAAALVAFMAWLFGFGRERPDPAPEDDIDTPTDFDELEQAEREVQSDRGMRSIAEAMKDPERAVDDAAEEDDWGPGTGRGGLPGII